MFILFIFFFYLLSEFSVYFIICMIFEQLFILASSFIDLSRFYTDFHLIDNKFCKQSFRIKCTEGGRHLYMLSIEMAYGVQI